MAECTELTELNLAI